MLALLTNLAQVFRANGYDLYLVGGSVRDQLLGREAAHDADLTTNARPDEIKRLAAQTHPLAVVTVGEQFGTVRLHYRRADDATETPAQAATGPQPASVVADAAPDVEIVEITTYRSDRYNPESRKPEVTFGDTLAGDLLRRDFTINAMARDLLTGDLFDPYGGRADLERKLIRAVGDDPERRFDEDPLRMLRAARFAAQLSFAIEPKTAEAIRRQATTLEKISRERIRDEFTKLLVAPNPSLGLRLLVELGLMLSVVPEALELRGVSQAPAHSKDVYEHVLRVVERTPPRPATRWAGLLHDIAKPRTKTVEEGKVHFFGHEDVGAAMGRDILRRLKFDRPFIEYVTRLVRMHMRANAYMPDWTDGAVRRLMLEAGDGFHDLLDLSRADITSYRPDKVSRAVARINELEARGQWLREEAERVPLKSPLDGNDLMEMFGRGPGAWLRPLKDHLLALVIDGQLAPDDRAGAEAAARVYLAEAEGAHAAQTPTPTPEPAPTAAHAEPDDEEHMDEAQERTLKRAERLAARRQSRVVSAEGVAPIVGAITEAQPAPERPARKTRGAPRRRESNPTAPDAANLPAADAHTPHTPPHEPPAVAARDELTRFLDDYLQIARFRDVAPNGMQVIGKPEVRRVALGVSAHSALFERAVAQGADLIVVHHGLFLDRDPHRITARLKARLRLLFDADITLLGYHLPLDAHPVVGNNAQWLRRLGFEREETPFGTYQGQAIGAVGTRATPIPFTELVARVAELAGAQPLVYAEGAEQVRRLAVNTGAAPYNLDEAVALGCDAYLTGEVAEGTQAVAREERANFLAAGHYNTERFGVQALGDLLRERFGVETFFIDVPNDA